MTLLKNSTPLVSALLLSCLSTVSHAQLAFKLMPLGDSITQGVGGACSYRTPLVNSLSSCSFETVGLRETPFDPATSCIETNFDHEGRSGFRALDFLVLDSGNTRVQNYAAAEIPDVVLLHVGSNDINRSEPPGTFNPATGAATGTVGAIDEMIDEILIGSPGTTVFVADVIPWLGASNNNNITADFAALRTEIGEMVTYRANNGDDIIFVPMHDSFLAENQNTSLLQSDGIHPNAAGDAHIAGLWESALQAEGYCLTTDNTTTIREEAENGTLVGTMQVFSDNDASGNQYVSAPSSSGTQNDYVDLSFTVQDTGVYKVLAKIQAPSNSEDRFYFEMVPGDIWSWAIPVTGEYSPDYVRTGNAGPGRLYVYLQAGTHTARVYNRDLNARLDWLELQYLGDDPSGDVDGDGTANSADGFPNDSSQSTSPDTEMPEAEATSPAGANISLGFTDITGTATDDVAGDGSANDTGVAVVSVRVQKQFTEPREYWDGNGWITTSVFLPATTANNGTTWTLPDVDLDEVGNYRIRLTANDFAGNFANSGANPSTDFTVVGADTEDPEAEALTPKGDGFLPGTMDITGDTSDNSSGVNRVRVRVQRFSTPTTTAGYWDGTGWISQSIYLDADLDNNNNATSWTLPGVNLNAIADYRVYVIANDNAGNVSSGAENPRTNFSIVFDDNDDPSASATSPSGTSVLRGQMDVSGISDDGPSGSGVKRVRVRILQTSPRLYWDGGAWVTGSIYVDADLNDNNNATTWTVPDVDLDDVGKYRVHVIAVDNAGNVASAAENPRTDFVVVYDDNEIPSATIDSPDGSVPIAGAELDVTGNATDNDSGIDRVRVRVQQRDSTPRTYWDGDAWVPGSVYVDANLDNNSTNTDWTLPDVDLTAPGNYRIHLIVVDNAGNTSFRTTNPTVDFVVQ